MFINRSLWWALSLAVVLLTSAVGRAAVFFPVSGSPTNAGGMVAGTGFNVVGSPVTFDALGFFDENENGLVGTYQVGLWRTSDQQLLASTTVGPGATLSFGYRYSPIAPITLPPDSYVLGALLHDVQQDAWLDNALITLGFGFTGSSVGLYEPGAVLTFPTQTDTDSYAVANAAFLQLPEPGSLVILGVLAGAALCVRRRSDR